MRRPVVTVHIVMRNIPDPFIYEVPVAEWMRMRDYLRKGSTPVFGFTHDPADIAWLMTALDTEPMSIPLFWPVQDSRGEFSTIASADIIIAEMDSAVVEEGLKAGW